jgi:hypothetical protein
MLKEKRRWHLWAISIFIFDLFILAITFGLYYYIKQIFSKKEKKFR